MTAATASLILPWPAKELSPNARVHHHAKSKAVKAYREGAYWLTRARDLSVPDSEEVFLLIDFYPPDKRRRDLDNMLSAFKAGLDGIADALEVNDHRFSLVIRRRAPRKGGEIVVRMFGPQAEVNASLMLEAA